MFTGGVKWFAASEINKAHSGINVRQIYLWFITSDRKVAIVSKDNIVWQLPGGKPKKGESLQETIKREMWEEVGLDMKDLEIVPIFFGYYLVGGDKNKNGKFLQLRFIAVMPKKSNFYPLLPKENPIDPDLIVSAKFVELDLLPRYIPWIEKCGEYLEVLKQVA